jgi:hypothetical protein
MGVTLYGWGNGRRGGIWSGCGGHGLSLLSE